jgi:DNA-damage-inducible protein J
MSLNSVVRVRIDEKTKKEAEAVLSEIGLTVSDAVRLMMIRIAREKAMPFNPLIPNEATIAALREARAGKLETVGSGSIADLLSEIDEADKDDEEFPVRLETQAAG